MSICGVYSSYLSCSILLYKSGDRARIADVKKRFVAKGGDGEIFDQATALNVKDQEINDLIFDSKKKVLVRANNYLFITV